MDNKQAIKKLRSQRDEICNGCLHAVGWCESHCGFSEAIEMAIEALRQPEPKEGHWIRTDCGLDVECKCSVCGYKDFVEPDDTYWFKRNYCPNCGAKMTISTK